MLTNTPLPKLALYLLFSGSDRSSNPPSPFIKAKLDNRLPRVDSWSLVECGGSPGTSGLGEEIYKPNSQMALNDLANRRRNTPYIKRPPRPSVVEKKQWLWSVIKNRKNTNTQAWWSGGHIHGIWGHPSPSRGHESHGYRATGCTSAPRPDGRKDGWGDCMSNGRALTDELAKGRWVCRAGRGLVDRWTATVTMIPEGGYWSGGGWEPWSDTWIDADTGWCSESLTSGRFVTKRLNQPLSGDVSATETNLRLHHTHHSLSHPQWAI